MDRSCQKVHYFQAYGLRFGSCISVSGFEIMPPGNVDVLINYCKVPQAVSNAILTSPSMQIAKDQFLLSIEKTATYYVQGGSSICIQAANESDEASIRFYLLGIVMGMLLHQRKMFVMHASAVKIDDACILFAAPSGFGKSSLAAAFSQKGYALVADDLAAIQIDEYNIPRLVAGVSHIKLADDSAQKLGLSGENLFKVFPDQRKHILPINCQQLNQTLPIAHIFELQVGDENKFILEQAVGMEKFNLLRKHTFKEWAICALGLQKKHFEYCLAMHSAVAVSKVTRPAQGFQLAELRDFLSSHLATQRQSQSKGLSG